MVQAAKDTGEVVKSDVAQLLGMKGAGAETNKWKIRLQLTKPVTWVPLVWGAPLLPVAWMQACLTLRVAHVRRDLCVHFESDLVNADEWITDVMLLERRHAFIPVYRP